MPRKSKGLLELIIDAHDWLKFGFTLVVPPIVGVYLIVFTSGKTRLIGLGFLVYSFSLFIVLPSLLFATWAKPRSNVRLFAAGACFVLAFFVFFFMKFALTRQDPVACAFSMLPIFILGLVFAGWWARDWLADEAA